MAGLLPLWRWSAGRQGSGYRKLPLARGRTWDAYVIDYPPGSHVPPHRDPVPGMRHYRLNLVVLGDVDAFAVTPGQSNFGVFLRRGPIAFFRPDLVEHAVNKVNARRLVLSVGWVRAEVERG